MYKCSECGTEYEVKPEYCDCGNDVFEEIIPPKPQIQEPKQEQKIVIKQPAPKVEAEQPKPKNSKSLQTPKPAYDYSGLKNFFDPVSTVVFLCLIAAAMYVTWIGYDPEFYAKKAELAKAPKEEIKVSIPDIDTFWDNTPVARTAQMPKPEPVQNEQKLVQLVEQVFKPQPKQQTVVQPQKVQTKPQTTTKQTTPKTQTTKPVTSSTQSAKSNAQTTKTTTQTAKPTTSSTAKTSTATQTSSSQNKSGIDLNSIINNNKKYTNNTQQQTSNQTSTKTQTSSSATTGKSLSSTTTAATTTTAPVIRPSSGTSTTTTTSATSNKTTTPTQTVDPAVAKQELANYKIGLRNTIGKKIDFTRVVGDGECSLSFKINSSGQLINRAFTKQSSNITLNDAAYAAMNATTRYNVPPSAYKGETLNLSIKFYNGNFSISLN